MSKPNKLVKQAEHLLGRILLIGKIFIIFVFGVLFPMLLQIATYLNRKRPG